MTMTMASARRLIANAAAACSRHSSSSRAKVSISHLPLSVVGGSRGAVGGGSSSFRHSSTSIQNNNDTASTATTPPLSAPQSPSVESYVSGPTTHFGYENVSINEKEGRVKKVFENVADNYDIMNNFMSAGLHRLWKDELLRMTGVEPMAKFVELRQRIEIERRRQRQ